jgi:hypothetical protein
VFTALQTQQGRMSLMAASNTNGETELTSVSPSNTNSSAAAVHVNVASSSSSTMQMQMQLAEGQASIGDSSTPIVVHRDSKEIAAANNTISSSMNIMPMNNTASSSSISESDSLPGAHLQFPEGTVNQPTAAATTTTAAAAHPPSRPSLSHIHFVSTNDLNTVPGTDI